jgi:alkylhydroperoxidase/carboxymuconolactone decarboxylase family protein YurZ
VDLFSIFFYNFGEVYFTSKQIFMKLKNLIAMGLVAAPVAALAGPPLNGAGA